MHHWSATRLLQGLESRLFSSRELVQQLLARIEERNPALNAVVTLDAERAFARAGAADADRARGRRWGALHGLPITIKDTFATAGLRTTAGSPDYADYMPAEDAVAVARLRAAGAIVLGKTNTAELAGDLQCDNPLFGRTNNPWDMERTSGGSSGGSAAALAAALTPLELGSDIGGSIRLPAHFCGVCGHKPTHGLVPMRGHIPGPPGTLARTDLAVAGPMARSVEDLALALELLAGPDEPECRAWSLTLPQPEARRAGDWRIAVWSEQAGFPLAAGVREGLDRVVSSLLEAGARVDSAARPASVDLSAAHELFYSLLAAAMSGGLTQAEIREGRQLPGSGADDSDRVRFYRSAAMSHRRWQRLHEQRLQLAARWQAFFDEWDVLLCPVAPVPAFAHDLDRPPLDRLVSVAGVERPYSDLSLWCGLAGLPYLPATVVPAGQDGNGLPVGIQVVGPRFGDRLTLAAAALVEEVCGGFAAPGEPISRM
ncbi:amidase [Methylonatrum kenyense]|uniref:amidase n=1 Tax=Methylonatrum kenyense TaxID=455253 RepID=UPI0020C0AED1|nr:amidase [Methylonatrum kenyense]MCK8516073.1 amidase [Methylonatrum kenyense]